MNIFPVLVVEKVEAPWNIHCLNLDTLPAVDVSESEAQLNVAVHLHCSATYREQSLRDSNDHTDALLNVKNTIHVIVSKFEDSGVRVFEMRTNNHVDTIIFVTALRLDLASHGYVIDAQVLTLTEFTTPNLKDTLAAIHPETRFIDFYGEEAAAWKRLLPAFAERCRTWKHGQNCEYLAEKKIPLSLEHHRDPLCSCGKGKDVPPNSGRRRRGDQQFHTSPASQSVLYMAFHTWKMSVVSWIGWWQQNHRSRRSGARSVRVLENQSYLFAVVVKVSIIVLLAVRRRIGNLIRELVVNNRGWVYYILPWRGFRDVF